MSDSSRAYNSVWQLRGDSWCRLDEASDKLSRCTTNSDLKDEYISTCRDLLEILTPLEPYWAYPGMPQFSRVLRLFAAGYYDKFGQAVGQINRALTTESYRSGDVEHAGLDEHDLFPKDPRQLENQAATNSGVPYFEVLVVESMTEEQERLLRNEVRGWRRPDDEFVYELVVVSSGDEALIAARLNVNLQAVVIRRRFSQQSTRDLSTLSEFVDTKISDELADHKTPDERVEILAKSLSKLRPELDLYLMTEIEVEEIAGRLGQHFRRVFHAREGVLELHLSILQGVAARYRTPFFSALKEYSHRPTGVFHALPISQGKSIVNSHWIKDMVGFYGLDVFMAETSATCGGLDSLLEPTGPLREAQQLAAEAYGSRQTFFVTNGTSTANKIVTQSLVAPGDIVLLDRNCHQSHHYGMMLAGAQVVYLEAYPLPDYSMYGAVPLREIKSKLLALKRARQAGPRQDDLADQLHVRRHRLRRQRVMEECLAIKPDLVFLWDEAWFAFARFHPVYRERTAMTAARTLRDKLCDEDYRREFEATLEQPTADRPPTDDELLNRRLIPDPAKARVRVYATQSTHKTLTSLRQGSMIHVFDQDFAQKVAEPFHEAYMAHTSTSPNYQILASLDLGRRQVALEGVELVQRQIENAMQLRDAIDNHPLLSKYMACLRTSDLIPTSSAVAHRGATAVGPAQHDGRLGAGRVRARSVAHHLVDRTDRLRRRHLQARAADGPPRGADQQDVTQHSAVHDKHRHHPQLGGVPGGGARQDRPRTRRTSLRDGARRARPVRAASPKADDRVGVTARLQRLPRGLPRPQRHRGDHRRRRPARVLSVLQRHELRVPVRRGDRREAGCRARRGVSDLRHAVSARIPGAGARAIVQP